MTGRRTGRYVGIRIQRNIVRNLEKVNSFKDGEPLTNTSNSNTLKDLRIKHTENVAGYSMCLRIVSRRLKETQSEN